MSNFYDSIGTIAEDDDIPVLSDSSASEEDDAVTVQKKKSAEVIKRKKPVEFVSSFEFQDEAGGSDTQMDFLSQFTRKKAKHTPLDDIIANKRKSMKAESAPEGGDSGGSGDEARSDDDEHEEDDDLSADEMKPDAVKVKQSKGNVIKKQRDKTKRAQEEWGKTVEFSESVSSFDESLTFHDMHLSRPILKALSVVGFEKPTPIQAATIPKAMMGKDLCCCAVTGSGKTAAFMLPVLERLLFRPASAPTTRVLVLVPTRELALQVYDVGKQLSQYSDVTVALAAGGLDLAEQEHALRRGPDIVVATPGRLIDILHNSPGFTLNGIEILVLDEADRMLDEYFEEQMKELIRLCATNRQTMLFSATMTEQLADLARVSLKSPVRVFLNRTTDTALGLRQEFLKIRAGKDSDRRAVLAALVRRTFRQEVLVFTQTRDMCHELHVLLGLLGVNVGELHGRLSQQQRMEALRKFKAGELDILLATDLASRGLDIDGVKTVINFTMPNTLKHYVHRVGRTARAGRIGRSISMIGDQERKMLKDVVKHAITPLKRRIVPPDVLQKYRTRVGELESVVKEVLRQEAQERHLRAAENYANRAERALNGEIDTGPERGWFQTPKERRLESERLQLEERTGKNVRHVKQPTKKEQKRAEARKSFNADDRVAQELRKSEAYAKREAKRDRKPKRLRTVDDSETSGSKGGKKRKKAGVSSFANELTSTGSKSVRAARHKSAYKSDGDDARKSQSKRQGGKFKSKAKFRRK